MSQCPFTLTVTFGLALRVVAASSRTAASPGRIFDLLKSKCTPRKTSRCLTGGGGGGGGGGGEGGGGGGGGGTGFGASRDPATPPTTAPVSRPIAHDRPIVSASSA